jgi:hypothetical protein
MPNETDRTRPKGQLPVCLVELAMDPQGHWNKRNPNDERKSITNWGHDPADGKVPDACDTTKYHSDNTQN